MNTTECDHNWNVGTPPCRKCGTWPEEFYVVEGSNSAGGSCSFGHKDTVDEAIRQLNELLPVHPEYTAWRVTQHTPVIVMTDIFTRVRAAHKEQDSSTTSVPTDTDTS